VARCITELQLRQFLADTLPPTAREQLEAHIEECPVCQHRLELLTADAGDALLTVRSRLNINDAGAESQFTIPGVDVLEEIGRGLHGIVYRAIENTSNRAIAAKVFYRHSFAHSDLERDRFRQESQVLATLNHPNIVTVLGHGESQGRPYVLLELVVGGTLASQLKGSVPSSRMAAQLLRDIARGVQDAHTHGIIHRDLKPSNILLLVPELPQADMSSPRWQPGIVPKLTDFGLAKWTHASGSLTESLAAFGTPSYMAPELAKSGSKSANPLSDVYSLGAIGYELLTGHPPFRGQTAYEILRQSQELAPVPPRGLLATIPRDLENIILKCLHREPWLRYRTAQALADDLDRFLDGKPVHAHPLGVIGKSLRVAKRHPRISIAAVGVFLFAVASFVTLAVLYRRAESNAERATRGLQRARDTLRTVARTREQQFLFPQNIRLQDPQPLIQLFELHAEALPDYQHDPDAWHDTSYAMMQLANMLSEYPKIDNLVTFHERGYGSIRDLIRVYPNSLKYRLSFAEASMQLSSHLPRSQRERIRALRHEAVEISSVLLKEYPTNNHYLNTHAAFLGGAGLTDLTDRHYDDADRYLSEAVKLNRLMCKRFPNDPQRVHFLTIALERYQQLLVQHFYDPIAFRKVVQEQIVNLSGVAERAPQRAAQFKALYWYHLQLATLHQFQGETEQSTNEFRTTIDKLERIQRELPDLDFLAEYHLRALYEDYHRRLLIDPVSADERLTAFRTKLRVTQERFPTSERVQVWALDELFLTSGPRDTPRLLATIREPVTTGKAPHGLQIAYARLLMDRGEFDAAIVVLDKVISELGRYPTLYLPMLLKVQTLWLKGDREQARSELAIVSSNLQKDFTAMFSDIHFHDQLWKQILGTDPPKRPGVLPKVAGVPRLFQ
jgi:tRNA A-37 threonylcarbamoyl transferase component Bud32/tetratricopeptide (TPR) repeat protein